MKKLLGILTVIILLSSCMSGGYLPCPAYGNSVNPTGGSCSR